VIIYAEQKDIGRGARKDSQIKLYSYSSEIWMVTGAKIRYNQGEVFEISQYIHS
jgi:hypothetical protein